MFCTPAAIFPSTLNVRLSNCELALIKKKFLTFAFSAPPLLPLLLQQGPLTEVDNWTRRCRRMEPQHNYVINQAALYQRAVSAGTAFAPAPRQNTCPRSQKPTSAHREIFPVLVISRSGARTCWQIWRGRACFAR